MQARDPGFETRSASTATLHRLDISPAPSSSLTARRSVRLFVDHERRAEWWEPAGLRWRCLVCVSNCGGIRTVRSGAAVDRSLRRLRQQRSRLPRAWAGGVV